MKVSFWKTFRIIFVIFSLYLMGDAFYRWDGFSYYGSFSEFLLSVALTSILWSLIAIVTTIIAVILFMLIWLFNIAVEWLCLQKIRKIKAEQLHLFIIIFLSLGAIVWFSRRYLADVKISGQFKVAVLSCIITFSIAFTWLLRHKAQNWINSLVNLIKKLTAFVQERITPLVWLFGIWVAISVPLVAYHTWFKSTDKARAKELVEYSVKDIIRPNIILLTFDAMTARDMSLYGYSRPTTPFISEWSKEASVFTRVKAAGNFTAPTTASLMTGKRIWGHLRFNRMLSSRPIRIDIESLPLVLKKNGYYTMALVTNPSASAQEMGLSDFFDIAPPPGSMWKITNVPLALQVFLASVFSEKIKMSDWLLQDDFILPKILWWFQKDMVNTQYTPEIAFNKFLGALKKTVKEPYFVWIHVTPPHSPYLPPEPYMGMFDSSSRMRSLMSLTLETDNIHIYNKNNHHLPESVKILRARYDEFIRYCDKQFEEFIINFKKDNKINNTVIFLSSDHGESFEHNSLAHGETLYESETHIPLIIKLPDQDGGRIIGDLVEQVDIPATILDLAGIQAPSWIDGHSLLPLLKGGKPTTKPAFSMALEKNKRGHKIEKGTIAVWEGDYKLIHYLEKNESLLFNLKQDPDELNNLFNKEPETDQHLIYLIRENLANANKKINEIQ